MNQNSGSDQIAPQASGISRRQIVQVGLAGLAAPAIITGRRAYAAGKPIKIGYVSPKTGPLAGFAEPDDFILAGVRKAIGAGLEIGGTVHPVEIIVRDSQSSPSRASDVAADLILGQKIDLMVAADAPETVNPVSDQAEVNGVPCITTNCPWQPWFFGRHGDPKKGFQWTYNFFWGLEDVIASYVNMWDTVPTNKLVGGMFGNDTDGNAWDDPVTGFPGALPKAGYKLVESGRFQPMSSDFTQQISVFKAAGVDIVSGNMIPPDFATFWAQCAQQGFHPKVVTMGKALLFPSGIAALGERGNGLSCEIWWTPSHPFKSGLTGQSCAELAASYMKATDRMWTQPLGYAHALFEIALDVLKRTKKLGDADSIVQAIGETDYNSIIGPVNWKHGPVKNVCRTPLVAGQWNRHGEGQKNLDLVVCENKTAPEIPVGGKLSLLG